ncbi:Zinc finger protein-like 1 [Ophiophagus hannah]|uniref:Zinc finger protein-like 1 n=1 Tax=Ophiophagus hannah TaxID=8665 RepID=V8NK68_OPHHA|nr:Zinc finger protein-like 1 [Ophiophagus hannah]
MGLCKCPKRKVTNLFCFEHRVNVCEYCIVANHAKCIVQSYLQWLQDSDYNPNCRLCNTLLSNKETVRLVCYDLFHWSCLNEMANQLPQNTAPAGYQCPSCQGPVFPPTNLVSPVASALRDKLSTVNWARAGLRLPLSSASTFAYSASCNFESPQQQQQQNLKNGSVADQHTIVSMSDGGSSSRKIYDTREAGVGQDSSTTIDFDEDKYRRRPTLSWLAQLLKNRFGTRKQPRSLMQRFVIFLLIGGIGFLTLVVVMMKLGRASADNDPSLDPKFNPHIRVGQ